MVVTARAVSSVVKKDTCPGIVRKEVLEAVEPASNVTKKDICREIVQMPLVGNS